MGLKEHTQNTYIFCVVAVLAVVCHFNVYSLCVMCVCVHFFSEHFCFRFGIQMARALCSARRILEQKTTDKEMQRIIKGHRSSFLHSLWFFQVQLQFSTSAKTKFFQKWINQIVRYMSISDQAIQYDCWHATSKFGFFMFSERCLECEPLDRV